ncbi:hypothetical protein NVV93_01765 [Pseudomonas sp. LS44]|uniref:hypothetical protein n=1 Tax=Pseudomonas sp. LS44 TaxID=1357074 RepID=UPI00215A90AC|nr:hypothetical protein [Pseudomonas sp. LS44]UVE18154.1 hypothetical protein NVV93_01765 [Pseudomonas sp. LS44]
MSKVVVKSFGRRFIRAWQMLVITGYLLADVKKLINYRAGYRFASTGNEAVGW